MDSATVGDNTGADGMDSAMSLHHSYSVFRLPLEIKDGNVCHIWLGHFPLLSGRKKQRRVKQNGCNVKQRKECTGRR